MPTCAYKVFGEMGSTKYDRLILLTDEQAYGDRTFAETVANYRKRINPNLRIYNINLNPQGGHAQSPESLTVPISGWTDRIFDFIKAWELDKQTMLDEVRKFEI